MDLRRAPDPRPRVEALLLSAGGMKVPQLAVHLDCCEATVRSLLHRFAEQGLAAVHPQPPGFPPNLERRQRIEEALDCLLGQPQVWTVTTLSEALAAKQDIHLKPRTVRLYLKRMGPPGGARTPRCATGRIGSWRPPRRRRWRDSKKGLDGELDLFCLDKTGFSPSLPPTYTWTRPGVRPVVPYENPQHRRVNTLAALAVPGPHRHAPLTWQTAPRAWKAEHLLNFLRQTLPGGTGRPRMVVLDNASIHRSLTVRQTRRERAERGIWLWYLPAYSPELNDIERTFRTPGTGPCPNAPSRPSRR